MARATFTEPKHRPRHCDNCGRPYFRRNLVIAWPSQNKGHRVGWSRAMLRICTNCQPATESVKLLLVAEARIVKNGGAGHDVPTKKGSA
jgi:hypothetical protein